MYVSIAFQWYELFQSNEFWLLQLFSENSKIHLDSNFQNGSPLGNVWVHTLTFSYTSGSMKCDFHTSLLAAPLQVLALVASLRLRL
jgi:hypothetical protein